MNIVKAGDLVDLLGQPEHRALTFRAELLPLVGEPPFYVAPPTFAGHKATVNEGREDKGEAKHKFVGRQREDGTFPMVELESAEQFAKRLQKSIARYLPRLTIAVGEETLELLDLVHGSADGFLRESKLGDVCFRETEIGKALFAKDKKTQMQARFEHFPHRLLTGECDMQSGQSKDTMLVFPGCMWAQAIGVDALPLAAPKLGHMPLALAKGKEKYSFKAPGQPLVKDPKGKTIDSYNLVNAGNSGVYHGSMVSRAYVQGSLDFAGLRQLELSVEQQAALLALWLVGVQANIKNYLPRRNAGLRAKAIAWHIVPAFGDDIPLEKVEIGEQLLEGAPDWHRQALQLTATDLVVEHRKLALEKAIAGEAE